MSTGNKDTLTKDEVVRLKEHLKAAFKNEPISFGLIAKKPGEFAIVIRPQMSVSDDTIDAVKKSAIAFAKDTLGKQIDEQSMDIAKMGRIVAQ